jgi:hypothetical protein
LMISNCLPFILLDEGCENNISIWQSSTIKVVDPELYLLEGLCGMQVFIQGIQKFQDLIINNDSLKKL